MMHTRNIPQSFWCNKQLPWLELHSTWQNQQTYKQYRHSQLSIGAILEGETRCLCGGEKYHLQVGDLTAIPPLAPHSCNPANGQFRSYYMLYLDTQWCPANLPAQNTSQRLCTLAPAIHDAQLLQRYMHLVMLMPQCQIARATDAV